MATIEDQRNTLTRVQLKFLDEYLRDPSDGGAAYMRANGGTNKKAASVAASKILKMPKAQAELERRAEETLGSRKVAILKNVDFWLELRDDKEAKMTDRLKASENLGKYMQMFVQKTETTIEGAVRIVDDI